MYVLSELDTVKGALKLVPVLRTVAATFGYLGDAYQTLGKDVNGTSSCGTSGSSKEVMYVAKGNANACKSLLALVKIVKEQTNSQGQLEL